MRWRTTWSIMALACGLLPLGWLEGCGQETEATTTNPGDAAFPIIGLADSGAPSACVSCRESACRSQLATCQASPDCARYLACAQDCPVDAQGAPEAGCARNCASTDATTSVAVQALQACEGRARCPACVAGFDAGYVDANACGFTYSDAGNSMCQQCLAARCCTQYRACSELDGACDMALDCWTGCRADGGQNCVDQCNAALPEGTGPYFAKLECAIYRCDLECGDNGSSLTCAQCRAAACAPQAAAVVSSPEAALLEVCRRDCGSDAACSSGCDASHPTGVLAVNELDDCELFHCAVPCQ